MRVSFPGRQKLVGLAAGAGALTAAGAAIAVRSRRASNYKAAVKETWRPAEPAGAPVMRELVRLATLAANSHNTQPWRFNFGEGWIAIAPDMARRCPAVDPDDHHLFASLGCAAENVVQAAPAFGLRATPRFAPEAGDVVRIELEPSVEAPDALVGAIARRQCTRTKYDGRPVAPEELRQIEAAGRGPGVEVLIFTERRWIEGFLPLLLDANVVQMKDQAFVEELKSWIRFGYADALAARDGLFAGAMGNPVVPAALGRALFGLAFTRRGECRKYERQLRSSAGVAVFVAERADKAHWVEVGRCYQRFALQATALGLRHAFLNQPVEVPALRGAFASHAGIHGRRPDLVVRFGHGPELPRSLRRPVGQVIA